MIVILTTLFQVRFDISAYQEHDIDQTECHNEKKLIKVSRDFKSESISIFICILRT
jgi:hypothetical protein